MSAIAFPSPSFLCKFGSQGPADDQFQLPWGVAIDSTTDTLFVTNNGNHRVQVFRASDGTFLRKFGSKGSDDGQFIYPTSIAIDVTTGCLFVIDNGNHRVQVFREMADVIFISPVASAPPELRCSEKDAMDLVNKPLTIATPKLILWTLSINSINQLRDTKRRSVLE